METLKFGPGRSGRPLSPVTWLYKRCLLRTGCSHAHKVTGHSEFPGFVDRLSCYDATCWMMSDTFIRPRGDGRGSRDYDSVRRVAFTIEAYSASLAGGGTGSTVNAF